LLTLFALVLVIGTVVDDSIVVVEAVQAKLASGYESVYRATIEAMREFKSALITTSVVFMAVFIPVSFTSGTSGVFYKELGLTMAAAVALSLLNAITLCPALCKLILRPKKQKAVLQSGKWMTRYEHGVIGMLHHRRYGILSLPIALALLVIAIRTAKTGLVPQEDMGTIDVNVQCKPGYSLAQTEE
jgi:multidrug efflux pump subunit AcrB